MKDMSNRDKTILVVISIIIILVAGFFALIRPTYNNYMADVDTYNTTKAEWDGIDQKIQAIPTLQNTITEIYNTASKDASVFVNEAFADINKGYSNEKANAAIDEHIQAAIDNSNLNVKKLGMSGAGKTNLSYYYYTPNVVSYALLEAADVNGNYAADITELLYTSAILSQKSKVEVMTNTVSLEVTGTRENLKTFMEEIKGDKNALLITEILISDYNFNGGVDLEEDQPVQQPVVPQEPQFDEEGNPIEQPEPEQPVTPPPAQGGEAIAEGEGYSNLSMTVVFYNAKAIDKPELGE